jgi:hypothetical protein
LRGFPVNRPSARCIQIRRTAPGFSGKKAVHEGSNRRHGTCSSVGIPTSFLARFCVPPPRFSEVNGFAFHDFHGAHEIVSALRPFTESSI